MKKITVAVTVDDKMGIAFNKRRQSRDAKVIEDLLSSIDGKIYVSEYSLPLFDGYLDRVVVVNDALLDTPDGAACFIEARGVSEHNGDIDKLIVYRWNRHYPSDKKLDIDLENGNFKMVSETEFAGKSHDKITKNTYCK